MHEWLKIADRAITLFVQAAEHADEEVAAQVADQALIILFDQVPAAVALAVVQGRP